MTATPVLGELAPDFTLVDTQGTPVTLSALRGTPVVVVFVPFAFSGTCRGELCEIGTVEEIFKPPFHPYTEALLAAVLDPVAEEGRKIVIADKGVTEAGCGCPFAGRCHRQIGPVCSETAPPWQSGTATHRLRCHIPAVSLLGPAEAGTAS